MKETILKTIVSFILTAIATTIVNFSIGIFMQPNGKYQESALYSVDGTNKIVINLINYSDKNIDDVKIIVQNIDVDIFSSNKILIVTNVGQSKQINIPFLLPKDKTTIEISGKNFQYSDITFLNFKDKNIVLENITDDFFRLVWVNMLVYLAIYLLVVFYFEYSRAKDRRIAQKELDGKSEKIDEVTKQVENIKTELDNLKLYSSKVKKQSSEYRLYLHSRIEQLSRELNFWQNLMKTIVYEKFKTDSKTFEETIDEIRKELGTYLNKRKLDDPISIKFYEDQLRTKIQK